MNRLPAITLLVSAPFAALAPAAMAKPRVHTDVTVRNASGSALRGATLTAKRAHGRKLAVKLKAIAPGKRRTVHVAGRAHGWNVIGGASRCAVHAHHRVSCVVHPYATGLEPVPDRVLHPTPVPAPAPTPAPAATPAGVFAPTVDMSAPTAPDLPKLAADSGAKHLFLGFVDEDWGALCHPTWGGLGAMPAFGAGAYRHDNVAAFQQAGGEATVSFGGPTGGDLAQSCASVDDLAAAYQSVIDAYGVTRVDFDIEGAALADQPASIARDKAIVKLQQSAAAAGRRLVVGFTLPSTLIGLDAAGTQTVKDAIDQGVQLSSVNLLTMNMMFGGDMGAFATGAGNQLIQQLAALYPALSAEQVARMAGITPMLGINDQAFEIFGLADAATVQAWASQNHIGMLGARSLGRDVQCPAPVMAAQPSCSGVDQDPFAFAKTLGAFTG